MTYADRLRLTGESKRFLKADVNGYSKIWVLSCFRLLELEKKKKKKRKRSSSHLIIGVSVFSTKRSRKDPFESFLPTTQPEFWNLHRERSNLTSSHIPKKERAKSESINPCQQQQSLFSSLSTHTISCSPVLYFFSDPCFFRHRTFWHLVASFGDSI